MTSGTSPGAPAPAKVLIAAVLVWLLWPAHAQAVSPLRPPPGKRLSCVSVERGDSLWRISRRKKVRVRELKRINRLRHDTIHPGQRLCVFIQIPKKASRSVGSPNSGRLINGERLAPMRGIYIKRRRNSYGTNELITALTTCVTEVGSRRFKGATKTLLVGDLSSRRGGRLGRHASHASGRDVDLGFYYRRGTKALPGQFITRPRAIHLPKTWALIRCLLRSTRVRYVFLDRSIQKRLYRVAVKSRSMPRRKLDAIFQYGPARFPFRRGLVIFHWPRHKNHIHLRLACSWADKVGKGKHRACSEWGRRRVAVATHKKRRRTKIK